MRDYDIMTVPIEAVNSLKVAYQWPDEMCAGVAAQVAIVFQRRISELEKALQALADASDGCGTEPIADAIERARELLK